MPTPDKLEKLKGVLQLLREGEEYAKASDVTKIIQALLPYVKSLPAELNEKVDAKLARVRDGKDGKDGKEGKGAKGDKGDRGEKGESIEGKPGEDGRDGSPDSAEDIRNKLELLDGEDRLDASAVKGLPEFKEEVTRTIGSNHALWALMDVEVAGIIPGQSIQWDGVRWTPYTPAGSGGTPVWGENLTTQGLGPAFSLAHTPIVGTVRLFRGGAYQSAANGDYSIVGPSITLSSALQPGEVLVADYSYA